MKIIMIALVAVVILTCRYNNTLAQSTKADSSAIPRAYWVAGGLGASSLGVELMSNANAELGHNWLITGTAQIESEILATSREVEQYNLMAGKIYKGKAGLFSISTGLGVVYVDKPTIGIPVLMQLYLIGGQFIGVGLNACANLNSTTTTAGVSINIALGRIPTHK